MDETTVLIVEDELLIAKGLARKLKNLGYTVAGIVASGDAALERAETEKPDIVLMDIVIQGDIDGIETAQQIRQRFAIPVIYMTAYADDETLARAQQTEAYGYILKPFKEREVHATIQCALSKHRAETQVSRELIRQQDSNTAKSQFLSMAAHDLRSPLTTILGTTELLAHYGQKFSDERKQHYLGRIQNSVEHMNQLLEDVLALSRADDTQVHFEPVQIELVQFCRSLVEEFQTVPIPRIEFWTELHELKGTFDPQQLQHILMNLVSNGLKYSPETEKIGLYLWHQNHRAIFEVRDRGIGIPNADLQRLFEAFHRAKNVGKVPGTGLGMAIVKRFVDCHGGTIDVTTREGEGTTFKVELPLSYSDVISPATSSEDEQE